jgi:hypothetical protein
MSTCCARRCSFMAQRLMELDVDAQRALVPLL